MQVRVGECRKKKRDGECQGSECKDGGDAGAHRIASTCNSFAFATAKSPSAARVRKAVIYPEGEKVVRQ